MDRLTFQSLEALYLKGETMPKPGIDEYRWNRSRRAKEMI